MIYVMSDIHGNYEKYKQALAAINYKDDDTLFVLGDVLDRGQNPIKILQDMMFDVNVIPILGNHEFMAITVLKMLAKEITDENLLGFNEEFLLSMQHWLEDGGQTTLNEFKALTPEEKESVLEYLEEFALYAEVSCGGKDYVLVHAGLSNFTENRTLASYNLHEMIFEAPDYGAIYYQNKILVTGHTPTKLIAPNSDKIYKANNHIAIDCGCGFGGQLAVICLDDGREFYV